MARPAPRAALAAAVAAVVAALAFVIAQPAVSAAAAPVRIMPLGDSITGSPGCWRSLLWQRLQSSGYTNIDFVGTLPPQGCAVAHDGDNEGHGGFLATNIANQNQLPGWLSATLPDIVVMHLGTNDVWSSIAPATILTAFSKLVDQMRASNPNMKILVAKIIPMNPSSCTPCGQRVIDFNAAIPAWAGGKTTAQSPITVVDQFTGFSTATDTYDGVHPNAAGDQKMSDKWYPPLAALLSGATGSPSVSPSTSRSPSASPSVSPSASRSPSASPSPSGSPQAGKRCTATYKVGSQWNTGFGAEVSVANTGSVPITGWTVVLVFGNGQVVTQLWNGAYTQAGGTVTVKNMSYNGTIPVGGTIGFGFNANWSGVNNAPAVTCTPA
ncbi:lysophospholipase L1-like esterase [Allocatelliglobosispora scoriae]|uniref:Lysophospholipase L1-like esterase n=1 Tax=Allocatelliglobosispora scoriae TaxID=643052 RepID=A0A841BP59_9ACTN|nr:cellulose binding domain-containing protein [Allocatelliglobosispora scoriae]MBB5869168.1 lysophospholipase L1-like esterase [Allocatelliglobosispora scoriae]